MKKEGKNWKAQGMKLWLRVSSQQSVGRSQRPGA
jgi:hypothetical protein